MTKIKSTTDLATQNLLRKDEVKLGTIDPYENVNGASDLDNIDRTELKVTDRSGSVKDQDFVKDMDGDEDFYGDDEENQSGAASYTSDDGKYLGKGDWADKQFGEHQFDHKGDVDYAKTQQKK